MSSAGLARDIVPRLVCRAPFQSAVLGHARGWDEMGREPGLDKGGLSSLFLIGRKVRTLVLSRHT